MFCVVNTIHYCCCNNVDDAIKLGDFLMRRYGSYDAMLPYEKLAFRCCMGIQNNRLSILGSYLEVLNLDLVSSRMIH